MGGKLPKGANHDFGSRSPKKKKNLILPKKMKEKRERGEGASGSAKLEMRQKNMFLCNG
jgi:hypothetical protein